MDSYCEVCTEVTTHHVSADDPGSCVCTVCDHRQLLMVPMDD